VIKSQSVFAKEGTFDKTFMPKRSKQNNLTIKEYEESMKKELSDPKNTLPSILGEAERSKRKRSETRLGHFGQDQLIKSSPPNMITLTPNEAELKALWGKHSKEFKTSPSL
jgi:hypothetical protein